MIQVLTDTPEMMPLSEYEELLAKYETSVIEVVHLRANLDAADSGVKKAKEKARRSDDRVYWLCVAVFAVGLLAVLGWLR